MFLVTPCITVIIPVFNAEAFLFRTLSCIANQTYEKWKCILVNDGSTDNSLGIIKNFVRDDSRFMLIDRQTNRGVSAARNAAIKHLPLDGYSVFIDADDFVDATYMEYFLSYLEPCDDLLAMRWDSLSSKGKALDYIDALNRWEIARGPTKKLIRNSILTRFPFDESLLTNEDIVWNFQIGVGSNLIRFIPFSPLYHVTNNPDSLTHVNLSNRRLLDGFWGWAKALSALDIHASLCSSSSRIETMRNAIECYLEMLALFQKKKASLAELKSFQEVKKYTKKNRLFSKVKPCDKKKQFQYLIARYAPRLYPVIRRVYLNRIIGH